MSPRATRLKPTNPSVSGSGMIVMEKVAEYGVCSVPAQAAVGQSWPSRSWSESVSNVAENVPVKFEISPVEIRRAVPSTPNDAVEEFVSRLKRLKAERPVGFAAVISPGIPSGVQACPAASTEAGLQI